MNNIMKHSFHIPVLGLAFSIDSPIKVAKYGISSVLSIVDDELIERIRHYYANLNGLSFTPINKHEIDGRAKRITAYLNLVQELVEGQIQKIKTETFSIGSDLSKYFEMLAEKTPIKELYNQMLSTVNSHQKEAMQQELRNAVSAGDIDVNIMAKVDKLNHSQHGDVLNERFSDALSAIRGFANSNLSSSVVLSAGMNPRLYNYLATLDCFFPNSAGKLQKRIILKVSDFRSANIQAKYLAKKGIWISEFRVESGLNCGGHAFATEGFLLGPILEEFRLKKETLIAELHSLYQESLSNKGITAPETPYPIRFTAQGGIGTPEEQNFLLTHYGFDGTGWGSPFLLVPEATTVDQATLTALTQAEKEDFYLSGASPLGVPFNNFRHSTSEKKRLDRIAKGRPGSPCKKKYLITNTEFGPTPICTASRVYQHAKINELSQQSLPENEYQKAYNKITEKVCLCDGLATSAYINYGIEKPREDLSVSICPGPNTVYFDNTYSLKEMVDHIYGRKEIPLKNERNHFFINELELYITYLKNYVEETVQDAKSIKFVERFKAQLLTGIEYYESISNQVMENVSSKIESFKKELTVAKNNLQTIKTP